MRRNQHKNEQKTNFYERKKSLDSIKLLMKKNPSKAKAELLRELDQFPNDMYCWFYYGQISQIENNLNEAEFAYTKVAESTSRNKFAGLVGLADIARIRGNIKKAKRLYRQVIEEHPQEKATTHYMLARLEASDGNFDEAFRILNALDENCNATKLEKSRIYIDAGDLTKAQEMVESLIPEHDEEKRTLAYIQGKICIFDGDYSTAAYYFQQAREYKIKDSMYYKVLADEARLAIETKNYQLAVDNCEEALAAREHASGENYLTLGLAKQALKQYASAMTCFQLGFTDTSTAYLPKTACAYYLACLKLLSGEIETAEQILTSCNVPGLPPRNSNVELLLNIYITQQRYDEAASLISYAQKALKDSTEVARLSFPSLMIKSQTNCLSKSKRHFYVSYREQQAIDYKKSHAIAHVIERHQQNDTTSGIFAKNINIEELFDEIQGQLIPENKTALDLMDRYYIDYPNIGYSPTGEIVHRIGVVTMPGTKNILTMYPDIDSDCSKITVKDIKQKSEASKTLQNDRISRFNSRFANFQPPKK